MLYSTVQIIQYEMYTFLNYFEMNESNWSKISYEGNHEAN